MAREALEMSGCWMPTPPQKSLNPPPVPVDSIFGVLKEPALPNRSATTVANGYTVEEPTMLITSRCWAFATPMDAARMAAAQVNTSTFFIGFSS
jgi:phospholipase C